MTFNTETLFTSPEGMGITTASPLQLAICRAIDGRPIGRLWELPEVRQAFGGTLPPAGSAPELLALIAAIRSGKSMIASAKAIVASQTCSVDGLSAGDELVIPCLSTDMRTARVIHSHIIGTIQSSPKLRDLLVREPTSESIWLRHPSGRSIEILVMPLAKYGSSLVGRWIATAIFDEAPRLVSAKDGAKNLDESLEALAGRVRPGGQILLIGSPYVPFGPVYDLVEERFGKPGLDCLVIRAPGQHLNPREWTPAKCARMAREKPDAYRTSVLAEFADPDENIFKALKIERAMRKSPAVREPEKGVYYVAAMDPASTASAWTLVILGRPTSPDLRPRYSVVTAKQWVPQNGKPLESKLILPEIKDLCSKYRVEDVHSDQFSSDALTALAESMGLTLIIHVLNEKMKWEMASAISVGLDEGTLELPPDRDMREDLVRVRKKINRLGQLKVDLPVSGSGRHCDYFTSLGLTLLNPPEAPDLEEAKAEEDPFVDEIMRRLESQADDPYSAALDVLMQ